MFNLECSLFCSCFNLSWTLHQFHPSLFFIATYLCLMVVISEESIFLKEIEAEIICCWLSLVFPSHTTSVSWDADMLLVTDTFLIQSLSLVFIFYFLTFFLVLFKQDHHIVCCYFHFYHLIDHWVRQYCSDHSHIPLILEKRYQLQFWYALVVIVELQVSNSYYSCCKYSFCVFYMITLKWKYFVFANIYHYSNPVTTVLIHLFISRFGLLSLKCNHTYTCDAKMNGNILFSVRYMSKGISNMNKYPSRNIMSYSFLGLVFVKLYTNSIT